MNTTTEKTIGRLFFQTPGAHALSGFFSWAAIFISSHQIALHARHYTNPDQQRYIVRVLLIIPIYALVSWLNLLFFEQSYYIYFNTIRDCYEAFVIYNFLCLCYEYLGGEMAMLSELRGKPLQVSALTCTCCCAGKAINIEFLRSCKKATLQFCFMKPIAAAVTLILESTGHYGDGDFRIDKGYLYITIVYNVSYTIALYGLFLFYNATKELLAPYYPVLKFLTVKFIVFMSFWQGLALAIIEKSGLITNQNNIMAGTISAGYQNFILCVEMFFASILLRFAYPYHIYRVQRRGELTGKVALKTISRNISKSINPKDILQDTIHNFSPAYQNYAGANMTKNSQAALDEDGRQEVSYQVTMEEHGDDLQMSDMKGADGFEPLVIESDDDDDRRVLIS